MTQDDVIAPRKWEPIETAPENVEVWTIIDSGGKRRNEQTLKRRGRLWFYPDMSMYVYYQPTHWSPLDATH